MNFLEFARQALEEAEMMANEIDCACNTREEPCHFCWSLGYGIGSLAYLIEANTP